MFVVRKIIRIAIAPLRFLLRRAPRLRAKLKSLSLFLYDASRFSKFAGCFHNDTRESRLAELIMAYHQIEKGLTMPHRRLDFGHSVIENVMRLVDSFESKYGSDDPQCRHAAGCVRAYLAYHNEERFDFSSDQTFWEHVRTFDKKHCDIPVATQLHFSKEEFYASNESQFPAFARSRHTSRHYKGVVSLEKVIESVDLAITAPSACNRQHVRVHCVSNHSVRDKIFQLQNGSRGFGTDADKLLVVTADLADIRWDEERNDAYTNAGFFAMNLCYALHYNKIAHCVLNWSVPSVNDLKARKILGIKNSETIVLLIACGNPPDEFDIAMSPRKTIDSIFTNHE